MEIKFTNSHRKFDSIFTVLFLGAILCTVFATLDWLRLLPFALVGVILPLIPRTKGRKMQYMLWSILAVWLLLRFGAILDGGKLLANRMFEQSERTQSYEYNYFAVSGDSAVEAVLWLSALIGTLCALWGNKVNGALCGGWMLAMAYFGVTPGIPWLTLLVIAAFWNVLPGQGRWFHSLIAASLVVAIAFAASGLAPEPNQTVSALDDHLRDMLAAAPVTYEQIPVPTEVPEPEVIPPPEVVREQPNHGVQKAVLNILFILLATLALALLFIPAVIKDRAEKRTEKARAGFDSPDHAAAIRAMYLYAQKWRRLSEEPAEIPVQIYAIWQEAAYSDHTMNDAQREAVRTYMKETAESVWLDADWKKRLKIRYRICL